MMQDGGGGRGEAVRSESGDVSEVEGVALNRLILCTHMYTHAYTCMVKKISLLKTLQLLGNGVI